MGGPSFALFQDADPKGEHLVHSGRGWRRGVCMLGDVCWVRGFGVTWCGWRSIRGEGDDRWVLCWR